MKTIKISLVMNIYPVQKILENIQEKIPNKGFSCPW